MNKEQQFVIWLDGYIEASGEFLSVSRVKEVRKKLDSLFEHEAEKLTDEVSNNSEEGIQFFNPIITPKVDFSGKDDNIILRC